MNDCTNNGMNIWAVLLAAGRSTRLSAAGLPDAKQFLHWRGVPLYWHSACTMARVARLAGLVFVFPPERVAEESARLYACCQLMARSEHRDEDVYNSYTLSIIGRVLPSQHLRKDGHLIFSKGL